MTEIDWRHIEPVVSVDETVPTADVLRGLAGMDPAMRQGALIVVARADGTFLTFTYLDLAKLIDADRTVIELPLVDVLSQANAVATGAVDRIGIGIGDAKDLQQADPRRRLVVLEHGLPVGILVDRLLGGDAFDLATFDAGLFGHQAAMAADGDEAGDAAAPDGGEAEVRPRWLSAQVHAGFGLRRRSFKAGSVNVLTVGIAPADRDLIQSNEAFPHQVPEGQVHTMDVVVWAPGVLDVPLRGQFDVPHAGPTVEPARFDLDVPANLERVEARIEVLYRRRMIQAAILSGPVFNGADEDAPDDGRIELRRTIASGLDPEAARPFDAAVIVDGETVLIDVGGPLRTITLGGISQAAEKIQGRMYTAAVEAAHEDEDESPEAAVRKLLTFLAYQGHAMYDVLVDAGGAALAGARTVEVTLRNAGTFFPIEFLYERGTPGDDPQICPNWGAAFRQGKTDCPDCPAAGDGAPYVCPLGFWALSREIARRIDPTVSNEDAAGAATSNPSVGQPRLARLGSVVIGASDRVDAAGSTESQITATLEVARQLLGAENVLQVKQWTDWVDAVRTRRPPLLLAMPHTDLDEAVGAEVLQIGASSNLRSQRVGAEHVQSPLGEPGPVVLLLGCSTAGPEIGYLGFVPAFLGKHAAVVVGTVAKVLGRQTGPVAQEFLRETVAAQGTDAALSEVIRRTRGTMLLAGNVMGLTLTAYGNSDWLLAA